MAKGNPKPNRRGKSHHTWGFAVMSIPESGLFYKNGKFVTGKGREVFATDLFLFTRQQDAQKQSENSGQPWAHGKDKEEDWSFPVIPVLVTER